MNSFRIMMLGVSIGMGFYFSNCKKTTDLKLSQPIERDTLSTKSKGSLLTVPILYDIPLGCYFDFMDTLVAKYDSLMPFFLSEHLIVRANPWIIDTLENTDYYRLMKLGIFNEDNRDLIILKKGDTLHIPSLGCAEEILEKFEKTVLDLNIPEYKLRIIEGMDTLYTFPARVGRNKEKFLALAKRVVSLQTKPGTGKIIRIKRNPTFINPSDGERFTHTKRDDGRTTLMPQTPWLEPELDGHRYGHLIHPTTNPKTLSKAYSNGCVGVREADIWRIYYHAPVGTKVVFRYDLIVKDEKGDTVKLKNIYDK